MMGKSIIEIKRLNQDFSVCKVIDYSLVNLNAEYSFIGKTDEEKSLVCITSDVPPHVIERDDGWKGFRVQGILDFSLIGILSKIAEILAKNSISIFAISTYNTDYVLIKKENYQMLFEKANDFMREPDTLNRNYIGHGMNRRSVRKRDCIQLFLALNNLMEFLDTEP